MSEYLLELRFGGELEVAALPAVQRFGHRFFEETMSRGWRLRQVATALGRDRLALQLAGLDAREPERERRVLGPLLRAGLAGGRPSEKLLEFAAAAEVPWQDLVRLPTVEGLRFAAVHSLPGRPIGEALADLAASLIVELRLSPVVPEVVGLLSICDGEPAPLGLDELRSESFTVLPGGEILPIASFAEYRSQLSALGIDLATLAEARERWARPAATEEAR
jgi:hypothetical protein